MRLIEILKKFLRFGFLAWGGPVAQIALMHEELVVREKWIDEKKFTKVLGIYQALPGPEATELAVYFGHLKRGKIGGILAGLGFMLPGFFLVLILSWLYATYGINTESAAVFLYGIKPAVIGLIANAMIRIGKNSLKGWKLVGIFITAALADFLFRPNLVLLIFAFGFLAVLPSLLKKLSLPKKFSFGLTAIMPLQRKLPILLGVLGMPLAITMFLFFLKAGLVTFGGAYTVIPFLQEGAVNQYHWITNEQFLDGMALSAVVPAPFIIVATFIGYMAAGFWGAVIATIAIFLPAFMFTLIGFKTIERIMDNKKLQELLAGITAAVVGVILVTTIDLARVAFVDGFSVLIALASFLLLWKYKANVAHVIIGSVIVGVLVKNLVPM